MLGKFRGARNLERIMESVDNRGQLRFFICACHGLGVVDDFVQPNQLDGPNHRMLIEAHGLK